MELKVQNFFSQGIIFFVTVIAIVVIVSLLTWFIIIRIRKTKFYARLGYFILGFISGIRTIGQLKSRNLFLLYTIIIWFLYLLMSYFCFFCFDATSNLGLGTALAVMVFGGFGWAVPVQGGIGTFDVIVTQALVLFGIAEQDGLAYALLSHVTQMFAMLVLGLLSLLLLPAINRKKTMPLTSPHR